MIAILYLLYALLDTSYITGIGMKALNRQITLAERESWLPSCHTHPHTIKVLHIPQICNSFSVGRPYSRKYVGVKPLMHVSLQ